MFPELILLDEHHQTIMSLVFDQEYRCHPEALNMPIHAQRREADSWMGLSIFPAGLPLTAPSQCGGSSGKRGKWGEGTPSSAQDCAAAELGMPPPHLTPSHLAELDLWSLCAVTLNPRGCCSPEDEGSANQACWKQGLPSPALQPLSLCAAWLLPNSGIYHLCQGRATLSRKKFLLMLNQNLPWHSFRLRPLVLSNFIVFQAAPHPSNHHIPV